uniref:Uncharacterized protein n=1 Tax=Globisporangium ultimum (strain ATCC 200006 / CBS 805.95 / DAOM BR144) TaxID=431595 RepID=K3W698_GLOUD
METPSPPQQSSTGPRVVEQIKVEATGSSNKTSPAILILTASGCVAGVALIVLAVYVKKKQAADKHDDRLEGRMTFESNLLNIMPEESVTFESSLINLVAANRGRSRVSSLSMSSFHALQSPGHVEPNVAPL